MSSSAASSFFKGKRILITGANTGIGYHAAESMALAGGDVVLACRNEARARDAVAKIQSKL